MSTALGDRQATTVSTGGRPGGISGLLTGEWVKLRSLRSTWITLGVALVLMVLLGLLFTSTAETGGPGGDGGGPPGLSYTDPVGLSLAGFRLAQLAIGVVGVLLVTGEYTSGTIRSTFAAVPRRWPVVAAKATVFAALVLLASAVTAVIAFVVGQAALGDLGVGLGTDGVPRVLLGTALYLTSIGLLGMALGWLLRSTAGAVSTLFGLIFLLPALGRLLPSSWGPDVVRCLPGEAGSQVLQMTTQPDQFTPWTGFAVLVGYLVVAFSAAVLLLRRRDA
jgi:ABC-type transport system involved in multi-copper enzyme maturation permease subunit